MSHEIKTVPTHSTFEVVFWHVLIGVLTIAFLVGMLLVVGDV